MADTDEVRNFEAERGQDRMWEELPLSVREDTIRELRNAAAAHETAATYRDQARGPLWERAEALRALATMLETQELAKRQTRVSR